MKKILFIVLIVAAVTACKKENVEEEIQQDGLDLSAKIITAPDGRVVAISDFDQVLSGIEGITLKIGSAIKDFYDKLKKEKKNYPEGSKWVETETVKPLLTTLWDQYEPFYNMLPKLIGMQCPTGCVTCSVAQFLAFHEYPEGLTDYKAIKNIKNAKNRFNIGTEQEGYLAAKFITDISGKEMLNVIYGFYGGHPESFSNPFAERRTLKALGYENVKLHWGLNADSVACSLRKGNPVLGISGDNFFDGHGWVIDGFIKRELFSPKGEYVDSQYLFHFNWGWNGKNNGYFEPGIIDTRLPVVPDNVNPESRDYIYLYGFFTVTAEKP